MQFVYGIILSDCNDELDLNVKIFYRLWKVCWCITYSYWYSCLYGRKVHVCGGFRDCNASLTTANVTERSDFAFVCVCMVNTTCTMYHDAQVQNNDKLNEDRTERIIGREWRRFGGKLRHNKGWNCTCSVAKVAWWFLVAFLLPVGC